MTQQLIGRGAAPNDGTGDDPRTAADKINANFTELYARPPSGTPWPVRKDTPKIAGDWGGTALSTQAITASRQYFIPVTVPRAMPLVSLRLSVTTASAGTVSIGLYNNTQDGSGNDTPGNLVASVKGLDTSATGDKTGAIAAGGYTLQPGVLYWVSLIGSAAATLRALAVGSIQAVLGRTVGNTTVISYLYVAGSGSTLPATASTSLTAGTGSCPAVYLVE